MDVHVVGSADGAILAKFDSTGKLAWYWKLAAGKSGFNCLAVDRAGNILVAGYADAEAVGGRFLKHKTYLVKFSPDGKVLWTRLHGTENGLMYANSIALDSRADTLTPSAFELHSQALDRQGLLHVLFTERFDPPRKDTEGVELARTALVKSGKDGKRLWMTPLPERELEPGTGMTMDAGGYAYPFGALPTRQLPNGDTFLMKVAPYAPS